MAATTASEWRDLLESRLHQRWDSWSKWDRYYEGDHPVARYLLRLQYQNSNSLLGQVLRSLNNNYMPLVVDSASERLKVQGFRFGADADDEAWRIWQANGLDADSSLLHTEAIKLGEAYWMVQPNGDTPRITAEHPSQVIVAHAPGNRKVRVAALKKWSDGETVYANVYLPDRVVKYRSTDRRLRVEKGEKRWDTVAAGANPLNEVPIVPMANNPSMLGGGRSDLALGITDIQDKIEFTLMSQLTGTENQALPQRVMTGVEPPRDPTTGKVIPDARMLGQKLWWFEGDNVDVKEFSQAKLTEIRDTVDSYIGDIAAQARIPLYYFKPNAISNISAEALIGLDAGLVSKTNAKKEVFGEAHEEAMRLAFRSIDPADPRADAVDAEVLWKDTESRSQAQLTDAVMKEVAMGLPFESALEKLGYSPQAIDRILAQKASESFLTPEAPVGGEPSLVTTDGQV